jgi:hypothetical protein
MTWRALCSSPKSEERRAKQRVQVEAMKERAKKMEDERLEVGRKMRQEDRARKKAGTQTVPRANRF